MKKIMIKLVAICLCMLLPAGVVGASVYALTINGSVQQVSLFGSIATGTDAEAQPEDAQPEQVRKDETVYVIANADGTPKKIIVSDWIKNTLNKTTVTDKTELSDVKNTKGEESYTINNDNMKVWEAQGNDIYYQGNIEKELPVDLSIKYYLDGKNVTPDEIAGKSGKVTIRFDYSNNQYEYVDVNGEQKKVYVPFVMLTGMRLDNSVFTNIEVSNGKMVNDGERTIVVGIALPGMQSNLDIDIEKFEIPEYVEITADAENFKLGATMTLATNELFNKIDFDKIDKMDSVTDALGELTSAMRQLMDGSSQLYDGISTLLDKSGELISGISKLADGAKALKSGAEQLNGGADQIKDGAKQLSSGLDTLNSNSAALNGGAEQVFNSLLGVANDQLKAAGLTVPKLTVANYSSCLNKVMKSIDEKSVYQLAMATAQKQVTDAVKSNEAQIRQAVTAAVQNEVETQVKAAVEQEVKKKVEAAVRTNVEAAVLQTMDMTKDTYDAAVKAGMISSQIQAQIKTAIDNQMKSSSVKSQITQQTAAQMKTDAVKSMISSQVAAQMKTSTIQKTIADKTNEQEQLLIQQNMNSSEVQNQITAALQKAKSGAASISALKAQLDRYNEFYTGLKQYTDGVEQAADGAKQLSEGAQQLSDGTTALTSGTQELLKGLNTLQKGTSTLTSGVTKLKDGAMRLSEGLKEFNEKGVQKIIDVVDGDVDGLLANLKATVNVSKNYKSFAGISDDMDGKVKFIYRTDSVKNK